MDAAWKLSKGGIGGLIWNKGGSVVYTFSGPSLNATCILEAEVEAILHVMHFFMYASRMRGKAVICSDSSQAVNSIYGGLEHSFPLLWPSFDTSSLLKSSVQLNYIPSVINEEAHDLATAGIYRECMSSFRL